MTFLERIYCGILAVTIVCFGWYFLDTFIHVDINAAAISDHVTRIWIMFGIYIGLTIAVTLATWFIDSEVEDEFDERDNKIDMFAERVCSYFQAMALLGILVLVMYEFSAFIIAHVVLATIVLTSILGLAVRLYLYRRGI